MSSSDLIKVIRKLRGRSVCTHLVCTERQHCVLRSQETPKGGSLNGDPENNTGRSNPENSEKRANNQPSEDRAELNTDNSVQSQSDQKRAENRTGVNSKNFVHPEFDQNLTNQTNSNEMEEANKESFQKSSQMSKSNSANTSETDMDLEKQTDRTSDAEDSEDERLKERQAKTDEINAEHQKRQNQKKNKQQTKEKAEAEKLAKLKKANEIALQNAANALQNQCKVPPAANSKKIVRDPKHIEFQPPSEHDKRSTVNPDLIGAIINEMTGPKGDNRKEQTMASDKQDSEQSDLNRASYVPNSDSLITELIEQGIVTPQMLTDLITKKYAKKESEPAPQRTNLMPPHRYETWIEPNYTIHRPKSPNIFENTFNANKPKLPMPGISLESQGTIKYALFMIGLKKITDPALKVEYIADLIQRKGTGELYDIQTKMFQQPGVINDFDEYLNKLQQVEMVPPEDVAMKMVNEADMGNKDYLELLNEIEAVVGKSMKREDVIRVISSRLPDDVKETLNLSLHTIQANNGGQLNPIAALTLARDVCQLNLSKKRKNEHQRPYEANSNNKRAKPPFRSSESPRTIQQDRLDYRCVDDASDFWRKAPIQSGDSSKMIQLGGRLVDP